MEALRWIGEKWFDLLQTFGIIGGLLFTAYAVRKDENARKIANLIALQQQYRDIWKELYNRPGLIRILQKDVDLKVRPITDEEWLFAKLLILHLNTVYRAMQAGMLVQLEGLQKDAADFFAAPIPRLIWEKMKFVQDADFVKFVEGCLRGGRPLSK